MYKMLATSPLLAFLLATMVLLSCASAYIDSPLLNSTATAYVHESPSYLVSLTFPALPTFTVAPAGVKARYYDRTFSNRDDAPPYPYNATAVASCWKTKECISMYDILSKCYYTDFPITDPNDYHQSLQYQTCVCSGPRGKASTSVSGASTPSVQPTLTDATTKCLACLQVSANVEIDLINHDLNAFCTSPDPNWFLFLNDMIVWMKKIDPMAVLDPWKTHVPFPLQGPITNVPNFEPRYSTDPWANQPSSKIGPSSIAFVTVDTTPSVTMETTPPATSTNGGQSSTTATIPTMRTSNAAMQNVNPFTCFAIKTRDYPKTKAWEILRWFVRYAALYLACWVW